MKRLVIQIAYFLIPLLLLILLFPGEKRLKYEGLKDDCFNHALWIHDRIFLNEKAVDIAFFGSSQSLNAINDIQLEEQLGGASVVNFAYCRLGRNLSYFLLRELLSEKSPQAVIMEVRWDENRFGHPIFPYLANSSDLLASNPLHYKGQFEDIYRNLLYKTSRIQKSLFQEERPAYINWEHGHSSSPGAAELSSLEAAKEKLLKKEIKRWNRSFELAFPKEYLRKCKELCVEKGVELYFLYVPEFGSLEQEPLEGDFYQSLGERIQLDYAVISDPSLWHDPKHLNTAGAQLFSQMLADELSKKLQLSTD